MKHVHFVKDLKSKREFAWDCELNEDVDAFLTKKIGHPQWELTESLSKFDKGELVRVDGEVGIVEDVLQTPFLLKERKLIACQRNPIYKVKIGEGVAYVTSDRLLPKLNMLESIKETLVEEDTELVTNFLQNLIDKVHAIDIKLLKEHIDPIKYRIDRILESNNLSVIYEGILDVLDESSIEHEMGELDARLRRRVISRFFNCGIKLPQVSESSGALGLTNQEMASWESLLGPQWQEEFPSWLEEGFCPTEVEAFIKTSRDPKECAAMRSMTLTPEDFANA